MLLFDENLSPRLVSAVQASFPGSRHVRDVGLKGATDQQIWEFAAAHHFGIVTKDDDFRSLSFLHGAPPKVIWLVIGNSSTAVIVEVLQRCSTAIQEFLAEPNSSLLMLRKG